MSEWKTYKLGEIAELRKEQVIPNGKEQPYIGLEHIEQQSLRLNGIGNSKDVISNKYKFYNGDILYGKLRPYFRKVYQPKFEGICSTDIFVIKNKKVIDKQFLYYLIATEEYTNIANSGSSGTRMPRADWNQLKEIIPNNIATQKEIARILSSLDDKIELNLQMNRTLESMAQAIFKEWFVNFNFSGFDGELVDGLPKGWKKGKLGEILNIKGGATPRTEKEDYWNGNFYWTTPKDLSNIQAPVLIDTERKITELGVKQISSGVLPKGTLLLSSRAPIGYIAISQIPISINQGYIAIQEKLVSNLFMLFWLKQNMNVVKSKANGSTFQEISKSNFKKIETIIPSKEILQKFDLMINPIFDKIVEDVFQIQTLTQTRDNLLPKLMSGKIEIKNQHSKN
jgi:type I restriction enzyme, S subunit